jgi:acyl-CoA synthetase (NDP forming)
MPSSGPNCYGLLNFLDGAALWPDQHGAVRVESGVALSRKLQHRAEPDDAARGLPLAYVVTVGNQAQTGWRDRPRRCWRTPASRRWACISRGLATCAASRRWPSRARLGKPIVALKAGRVGQARAAAVSHTASLPAAMRARARFLRGWAWRGSDAGRDAGDAEAAACRGPLALEPDRSSLSCSGGEASLMADMRGNRA